MKYLIVFLFVALSNSFVFSQKDTISCSIQVQDLWDLDLNKSTVMADFYLVINYKDPLDKKFTLLNSSIISVDTIIDNDSTKFLTLRIVAELRTNFDFDDYPLDKQKIIIKFEPYLYYMDLVSKSDPEQNIFVDDINLNGWKAGKISSKEVLTKYKIHGKNGNEDYYYSSIDFEIPIERDNSFFYFLKFYLPSLISILIIYIGFLLPPNQIEPRLNLSLGSLFVMISNFIVTQQMLPNISTITLIEKINVISLVIISLTILFFSISYRSREKYSVKIWYRLNIIFVVATITSYSVFLIILI